MVVRLQGQVMKRNLRELKMVWERWVRAWMRLSWLAEGASRHAIDACIGYRTLLHEADHVVCRNSVWESSHCE